jgi:hypothetical protein
MARDIRMMKCPGPCGEVKLLSVAVNRFGDGREQVVPSKCDDCKRAELEGRESSSGPTE